MSCRDGQLSKSHCPWTSLQQVGYQYLVNIFFTTSQHDDKNATVMVDHMLALLSVAHATKLSIVSRVITVAFEFMNS